MRHPVLTTPQADQDVREIALYIAQDRPAAGERFLDAFEHTCEVLATMPTLGSKFRTRSDEIGELRVTTIPRFRNFVVIHRLQDDRVEILRVVHGARDMDRLSVD